MMEELVPCCDKMYNFWHHGEQGNHNRMHDLFYDEGQFWLDMSEGEYGSMQITHCPWCGKMLEVQR